MEAGGFKLAKEHDFLPYQYFLVFTVEITPVSRYCLQRGHRFHGLH